MLAMVLNNEKQYNASEKSARYTNIGESPNISALEKKLYTKWIQIFKDEIAKEYGDQFNEKKIEKLAQENARYFVSVFVPTREILTVPFGQLNRIAIWLDSLSGRYFVLMSQIEDYSDPFMARLAPAIGEFIRELQRLGLLTKKLMSNRKERGVSLFADYFPVGDYFRRGLCD